MPPALLAFFQASRSMEHCVSAQLCSQVINQSTSEHGDGASRELEEGGLGSNATVAH
jgi:hypothetical protein